MTSNNIDKCYNYFKIKMILKNLISKFVKFFKEEEFENLSLDEKTTLKWKFLLKRCASRLVVMPASRDRLSPLYSVVSTEKVNLTEYAARVPMY